MYQLGAHCEHIDTVLYKAYLTTTRNTTSIYIGMTASEIKTIFNNQIKSFNHEAYKNETELSSHVWDLKRRKQNFSIVWSIISQHNNRLTSHNKCSLCLGEKTSHHESRQKHTPEQKIGASLYVPPQRKTTRP